MGDGDDWHDALHEVGMARRFSRGERLFLEGYRRGAVLVVRRGTVRITATTADGDEVTLALRGPGELIGDHSAVTGGPVGAGVVAAEDGEGIVVAADRFLEVLRGSPEAMLGQNRRLVELLHEAEERLTDIATLDIPARVIRQLARLSRDTVPPVRLPLTQDDLASMVGAARASVAPVLAELREGGTITTGRGEIIVNDPSALR